MTKFRKFLCGLLSASFCVNSSVFAVKKKQIGNGFFTKTRRNRFKTGRGLSGSVVEKHQKRYVSNNFMKYGKVVSWGKAGNNSVRLFFKNGKVKVVSFSLLGVLPLSVVSCLGIKFLYSYLPFLEWRIKSNLDVFLTDKKRETALAYLNSVRDYLCAKNGVDPNCKFKPYKKMGGKYIFSPGYAFDYAESQEKGISKDLIVAIVGDFSGNDKVVDRFVDVSKNKLDGTHTFNDTFKPHFQKPRQPCMRTQTLHYLGKHFNSLFGKQDYYGKQGYYCDYVVGNSATLLFDMYFDSLFNKWNLNIFRLGDKIKFDDSWFYGWNTVSVDRYNVSIRDGMYSRNAENFDVFLGYLRSKWGKNVSGPRSEFLMYVSKIIRGTWVSYALTVYYLGVSLFGSKEKFFDALDKEKNAI